MNKDNSAPIGIFDSGIGGLTVAHKVKELMPNESMVYFGDIAHLPYGDKSAAAIQAYSIKVTDVLLQQGCKLILIACNSASSAAFELVKEYVGSKAKVFNVIDPVVEHVGQNYSKQKVGLIGTKQTVNSNAYELKLKQLNPDVELKSLATPLLVPMIEEGFFENRISHDIIEAYLHHDELKHIEALILGCTHYPLIKNEIDKFYNGGVDILDSASIVAKRLEYFLKENALLSTKKDRKDRFLVSDITASFEASAKIFFHDEVHLEKYPIWD
ncbi:glutamate racemase [Marivirga harenae]|uniref:glutamate racemase n=1 Tax=Marivirga harenae TaxID=2010992 RepID=UPI0026E0918D|nr:glutamate racemase [Marivirga harenae]WKV13847.1 glutamate racemase [Marivirga harenae]|tara:strand:+ start:149936 stop:150748 length:813 start_codon:yes stop_codon:yes gene_type:complete